MAETRRVLIVDDDPIILEIVKTVLDLEDFSVETAVDGESALAAIEVHEPDALVLDVMMPGMSGFELCRKLRASEEHATLPIVLLTARDTPEDRETGQQAGADAYLSKPFSPLELIEVIEKLFSGRA